jgi:hypothetical protein
MDWRWAKAVEHLLYSYKALSSNPNPMGKREKKNKKKE